MSGRGAAWRASIRWQGAEYTLQQTDEAGAWAYARTDADGTLCVLVQREAPPRIGGAADVQVFASIDGPAVVAGVPCWSPDCDGCGDAQAADAVEPLTLPYRARFGGGAWQVVYYCPDCAAAARGEWEGAPAGGQPADAIEPLQDEARDVSATGPVRLRGAFRRGVARRADWAADLLRTAAADLDLLRDEARAAEARRLAGELDRLAAEVRSC